MICIIDEKKSEGGAVITLVSLIPAVGEAGEKGWPVGTPSLRTRQILIVNGVGAAADEKLATVARLRCSDQRKVPIIVIGEVRGSRCTASLYDAGCNFVVQSTPEQIPQTMETIISFLKIAQFPDQS
ncbi:MAG TPA: hypothetical protein VFR01_00535 [Geobacterales bacterium]|nr:hypothetical protein [Geobacterales bacterium]